MRTKLGMFLVLFIAVLTLSGCGEETNEIASYTSVTCLFTGTATDVAPDYGPIIIGYNDTSVTLMTENGNNVYNNQEEIDSYIAAKFNSDHYSFIENRVTGFEEGGYTCTYE
jgi:hypothetical protein